MDNRAQDLYNQRVKRVRDAVQLKEPDRVPLMPVMEAFPVYYAGLTIQEAMEDYHKLEAAFDKFFRDFQPDLGWDPIIMYPAKPMEILDLKWFKWPGHGIDDPNQMYQFIEDEYMTAEDYDDLIFDPTHYMQTKWIPRCFGALKGLGKMSLRGSMWFGFMGAFAAFADEELQAALKAIMKAGEEYAKWFGFLGKYDEKMEKEFGIPVAYGAFGYAPFDMIGDTLRGTVPILKDMYDRPDKLLKAIDKMTPIAIESSIVSCKNLGRPYVWIWLHKGIDEFMSDEHFKKFYWPSLQQYLLALVEADLIPVVYVEGNYNRRLDVIKDVPKGRLIYTFETTDIFKAKKVLGDVACIGGNVPNYMLEYGTKEEVEDYCKKLIDVCGDGGGFIMDTAALVDRAKPENLEAMFRVTQEYGKYK